MWIPDDAVEAAAKAIFECRGTGLEWGDPTHNDEPTRIRYRVQAQAAIDAAIPHVVAAQAARLRTMADEQFSKNIQTTLARGLTTAARIIEGGDTQ